MEKLFDQIYQRGRGLKKEPVKLANSNEFNLTLESDPFDGNIENLVNSIFENSINTQSPHFLNQLYGGSEETAWLGELLTAILNTSMATTEIAPLATKMELELIRAINEMTNFPEVLGLIVPGGSYANMMGIHCARYSKFPQAKTLGLSGQAKFKVFVSKDAHYSSSKSMNLMGLGTDNLVMVDIDQKRRMSVVALEDKIKETLEAGDVPLCVVSTAGTTVWGAFDPINEIQALCEKYLVWHHVDAAWGGLALWSEKKGRDLFEGIEKVDSLTLDFHKLMASTLTKGIFLTSKPQVLRQANSGGGEAYIFQSETSNDTGRYAIQCGRKVDSLPLWLQWKLQGANVYQEKIDTFFDLSRWFTGALEENSEVQLLHSPEFLNHCFQLLPKDNNTDIGEFNYRARELVMDRGNFMVNFASTDEHGHFFRIVFNHWGLNQSTLESLMKELFEVKSILESSLELQ